MGNARCMTDSVYESLGSGMSVFEKFQEAYRVDGASVTRPWVPPGADAVPGLAELMRLWAGVSFGSGLYRVHTESSSALATEAIEPYLPVGRRGAIAFAYDWLGRNFALNTESWSEREPVIMLVDLGEGCSFDIPVGIGEFHDVELVEYANNALAADWFAEWHLAHGGPTLETGQCVGYRTPLFLGGTTDDENLELIDTAVYWSISSQMYRKVAG